MVIEDQTQWHGLLAQQSEHELDAVQVPGRGSEGRLPEPPHAIGVHGYTDGGVVVSAVI